MKEQLLAKIQDDEAYTIKRIVQEQLLMNYDNRPMGEWSIRRLFDKGILPNRSLTGDGRQTKYTMGRDLKKYIETNY